jgi:hypothetical protein
MALAMKHGDQRACHMKKLGYIGLDNLMTLDAYAKYRQQHRADLMAHRQLSSISLGEHMTVQFESELTLRYQIQEMLRIEKIVDEIGVQAQIDAYEPLVPKGNNWSATLLLQYPDPLERKRALSSLLGVEERLFVKLRGQERIYAVADEDLVRHNPEKTSAVHFLRFELPQEMIASLKGGQSLELGCDHVHYSAHVSMASNALASLLEDFS